MQLKIHELPVNRELSSPKSDNEHFQHILGLYGIGHVLKFAGSEL